jgi:hypothetical protein
MPESHHMETSELFFGEYYPVLLRAELSLKSLLSGILNSYENSDDRCPIEHYKTQSSFFRS